MISTPWPSVPLRRLAAIVGGGTPGPDEQFWGGEVPFITPPDLRPVHGGVVVSSERTLTREGAGAGSAIVPRGSVIVSIRAPIGYVAISGMDAAFNQGCRALVPGPLIDARFLGYALVASGPALVAAGRGTTFMELSGAQMAGFEVPAPPVPQQRAIADFLDRETAQIDTLIDRQKRLIATLRERRVAVLADAIGLSGTGCLVSGSSGYRIGQVKNFGSVTLGNMLRSVPNDGDVEAPYLRAANIQPNGVLKVDDLKSMWFSHGSLNSLSVERGDVLVVEGGQGGFGRAAFVTHALPGIGLQNSINRIRPSPQNDGRFLTYFLLLARAAGFVRAYCNAVSMPHLTAEKLAAMPLPIPDPDEQTRIADRLDAETATVDELIAKADHFIALSNERRSALITAAVTGHIDVSSGRAA